MKDILDVIEYDELNDEERALVDKAIENGFRIGNIDTATYEDGKQILHKQWFCQRGSGYKHWGSREPMSAVRRCIEDPYVPRDRRSYTRSGRRFL